MIVGARLGEREHRADNLALFSFALDDADRARIEILLQRKDGVKPGEPEKTSREDRWNPILEVSRFDKQPLVLGHAAFALAVGDWNGDKKPDLAAIMRFGVMTTPALVVDGKVVSSGRVLSPEDIRKWIV